MTTLLLIRPEPLSRRLIEALAARGVRSRAVVSPVMEIRRRRVILPEGADLILTSQNALGAVTRTGGRAWCVGDRTAESAREAGLDAVSAGGDVEALFRLLVAERPERLVHVRGEHSAGNLANRLRAEGLNADEVVAYDQTALPLTEEAARVLASPGAVVLPLYSPRSAALVAGHGGPWRAAVHAVAISSAAAQAFDRPARVTVADAPDGAAMEDAIVRSLTDTDRARLVDRGGAG